VLAGVGGLCPRGQISLSDWIHLVIRIAQRVPLLPFVWPFEPLAPGLPFLCASSILADTTICLGISASGKLAGSVPGAQRRKTILNEHALLELLMDAPRRHWLAPSAIRGSRSDSRKGSGPVAVVTLAPRSPTR